ncbi:unnamed protein product [Echinostoma caproni]|uniref:RUN domain-containing protein n=1 Tax=Echinostoma caproni TaxID=27848 RepID=A0A183ADF7_9TREM|nr:unnamed protein product [Echinostoma caproni]
MENLHKSSVEIELASADECKANASRCWKSLVGSVSSFQADPHNPGTDRSHLLLTLEALHSYPVYLIRGVRHCLAAVFLLHFHGDVNRAADLCNEASDQLEHIGRRLQRVESKLLKQRLRQQPAASDSSDIPNAMSLIARAKQDAGWMHFWYYVLARIRSIIHSHEYQFRLLLDSSLLDETENEAAYGLPSDLSTGSSHTGDSKPSGNKCANSRVAPMLSPLTKLSPVAPSDSRAGRPAQFTTTSPDMDSVSSPGD